MVNFNACITRLADVTDRGAPQKEEIERRFEIEVPAPAEHTIFGTGNIRPRIFRHGKAAIGTRKIPFRPLELEAISRVADRAGDEYFPLNLRPLSSFSTPTVYLLSMNKTAHTVREEHVYLPGLDERRHFAHTVSRMHHGL
ncbi:MAG: hypothetical protein M3444_15290, partial [Acidobacteriota bacterium]|nr:hypothetical protein [Acidobacteriota bacterium]